MRNLTDRLQARLEKEFVAGADAARMTAAAITLWVDIAAILSPIIGPRGMNALYRRALSISATESPALAVATHEMGSQNDFIGLRAALSTRSSAEIATLHALLLRTFVELLASLIGESLTERLLNQVPAVAVSGQPQETPT